ncbi:RNHCP domain-containing protein [Deinococcus aetherius]|uniref:RNHCP domain-containing protein n=1 Tax=Deinococcus aetherius TaxID=200252 RepID=A0ABN6RET4_9DEIO|nr:RNHCP domain-containing protein [Deinococcus aetherius]BDP41280.1 RNHCP domain-containing protein [Deinococcus aetherius]
MTGPRRFTVRGTNNAFTCVHCGAEVRPLENGSVRNHCPACLYSLHVDVQPGDRANDCRGPLRPVGVEQSGKKGWVILYRCEKCGGEGRNRAALDDPVQPDSWDALVALSTGTRG